jgi:hypothetical protein
MVGPVQHAGGDMFIVDGQKMDLATLSMAVNMQRAELLDKQMGDQLNAMKDRNNQIKQMNDLLNKLRQGRPSGDGSSAPPALTADEKKLLASLGVNLPTGSMKAADYDSKILETMKTSIDNLNSQSQMDMLRFQNISDKRDLTYKMISNQIDKFSNTMQSIVQNMK